MTWLIQTLRAADTPVCPAVQHYLPEVVAAWDREAYNKPPGFDSSENGPALGGFLDVAAHSVGGRLQGKWKRVSLGGGGEVVLPGHLVHEAWLQLGTQAPAPGVEAGESGRWR